MKDFDYSSFFNYEEPLDKNGEKDDWKEASMNQAISSQLEKYVPIISELFSEWIKQIKLENVKSKHSFAQLINENDHFLSFNYTSTLEDLYGVENVCHIHGKIGESLLLGHEGKKKISLTDVFIDPPIGGEGIADLINNLKKDTKSTINQHQDFFKNLSNKINIVYSYGVSYGEVDLVYIEEILEYINTKDCKWYFYNYKPEEHDDFKKEIRKLGYQGEFFTFDC